MLKKEEIYEIRYKMFMIKNINETALAKELNCSKTSICVALNGKRDLPVVEAKLLSWARND